MLVRRAGVLVTFSALLLAGCSTTSDVAVETTSQGVVQSATPPEVAADATAWLDQLSTDAGVYSTVKDGDTRPDYDLTVDTAIAYLTMGDEARGSELTTGLVRRDAITDYVGDGKKTLKVHNTARLISTVMASGYHPDELSGRQLVRELKAVRNEAGRFVDKGSEDRSDTRSQAWAVIALSVADRVPASSVSFLSAQQCGDGGYPRELSDQPTGDCKADVTATALTISALLTAGFDGEAPEVDRAVNWLVSASERDSSGVFWETGKDSQPDVLASAAATIALVDAHARSGDALRWLRAQVVQSGSDQGAFARGGEADQRATSLGVLAFSGRGYSSMFN